MAFEQLMCDDTINWFWECNEAFARLIDNNFYYLIDNTAIDYDDISESFIRRFEEKINMVFIHVADHSIEFVREFADRINWRYEYGQRDDAFYCEFIDRIVLKEIDDFTLLSEQFIREFMDEIDEIAVLETAIMSDEFEYEIVSKLDWDNIDYNCVSEKFLTRYVKMVNWENARNHIGIVLFSDEFKCQFGLFRSFKNLKAYIDPINGWIKKELIEYLHQPSLIAKWIKAGNKIEDYLQ